MKLFPDIPQIEEGGIVLKRITHDDSDGLSELVSSERVYKYEPAFLYERKYEDIGYVIDHLYDEAAQKISLGCRLLEKCWGKGLATGATKLMISFLQNETDIRIIEATTMSANNISENVLKKLGFELVAKETDDDWGYDRSIPTDIWQMRIKRSF